MITLNRLRILIAVLWLIYVFQGLSLRFYGPSLYSLTQSLARLSLDSLISTNVLFNFILLVEIILIIYASAALFLAYQSGRIAFVFYLLLALVDNFFIPVRTFNPLGIFLENLGYLIMGVILLAIFTPPLSTHISKKKPLHFRYLFWLFMIFFLIFFTARYLLFFY